MKPKLRRILEDCIEAGIRQGWNRSHKHNENPCVESIWEEMENAIMAELYDYFVFDEDE